jgi:tetratricopeptide (TPR) repeat protein
MLFARFQVGLSVVLLFSATLKCEVSAQNTNAVSTLRSSQYGQAAGNVQIAYLQPAGSLTLQKQKDDAIGLFQAMQFAAAAESFKKLCVLDANSAYNHFWLAESLYEQNDFAAAANEFSRAVVLEPQNEKSQVRLAEATLASRDFSQAREAALRAVPNVRDERLKVRLANVLRVATMGAPKTPTCSHVAKVENSRKK